MHDFKMISGLWWMILIGFGAYLAYVPFGAVLFERIMASSKAIGTAVFRHLPQRCHWIHRLSGYPALQGLGGG